MILLNRIFLNINFNLHANFVYALQALSTKAVYRFKRKEGAQKEKKRREKMCDERCEWD